MMKQNTTETRGVLTAIAALALVVVLTPTSCWPDGSDHGGIDPFGNSGNLYTVTFNAGEGTLYRNSMTIPHGGVISTSDLTAIIQSGPAKNLHLFGWWT
ncbi:MAG: hypothetical protein LBP37_07370 [Spirochaetaceae bacterium]|jgi:hypothetical protein|nr:hypothetical protein [Spirochaetaceae bacterium]